MHSSARPGQEILQKKGLGESGRRDSTWRWRCRRSGSGWYYSRDDTVPVPARPVGRAFRMVSVSLTFTVTPSRGWNPAFAGGSNFPRSSSICVPVRVEASAGPAAHGRGARSRLPRPAHARHVWTGGHHRTSSFRMARASSRAQTVVNLRRACPRAPRSLRLPSASSSRRPCRSSKRRLLAAAVQ